MFPFPVARAFYHAPQPSCLVSLSCFPCELRNQPIMFFHADYMICLSCSLFQLHDQFVILPIPATWLAYHVFHADYMISLSCFPCKLHDQPIMFPYPVARSVCHASNPIYIVSLSFFPCKLHNQLMFSIQTTFHVFHANCMISLSCFLFQSLDQFVMLPILATWSAHHVPYPLRSPQLPGPVT
jgi:hypothetical protein